VSKRLPRRFPAVVGTANQVRFPEILSRFARLTALFTPNFVAPKQIHGLSESRLFGN
jgi:hypothetical protein